MGITSSVTVPMPEDPSAPFEDRPSIMDSLWDSLDCPVLDIGDRRGDTDYIDFIHVNELSHPITKGIDCLNRKFFCLQFTITHEGHSKTQYQTFFQRYTSNKYKWVSARVNGCYQPFMCGLSLQAYDMIAELVTKGRYVYDKDIECISDDVKIGSVFTTA